jgi:hypothetical protein
MFRALRQGNALAQPAYCYTWQFTALDQVRVVLGRHLKNANQSGWRKSTIEEPFHAYCLVNSLCWNVPSNVLSLSGLFSAL